MKKHLSLFLTLVLLMSVILCGCGSDKSAEADRADYVINNGGIINIGVIAPSSGTNAEVGNDVISGVKFANSLAEGVNIDQKYFINLLVCDLNDDIKETSAKFIDNNVAAVICAGTDYENTNAVIDAFKDYSTPIIFTDNYSENISSSSTAYSFSVPYTYQSSIVSAFLTSEGYSKGVVICDDDNYSLTYARAFKAMFEDEGGNVTIIHKPEYNSEDFVYIIGNDSYMKETAKQIKSENADVNIILSEVFNKNSFETDLLENVMFLSKFEIDIEKNHIGTDFINVFSNMNDTAENDITSAVSYGYDAYMLVYGALAKCNPNSNDINRNSEDSENAFTVDVSQINKTFKEIIHYGTTDTIIFNEQGLIDTKFIYLDKIENSKSTMLNRYEY